MSDLFRAIKTTTWDGPGAPKIVREGYLLGCGNPLLDMCAEVPESFFAKYDVKPGNAILAEEKHVPMYEELSSNYKVDFIAGGATQNSIRVAQWIMQSPGATSFVGSVGKDKFAEELKDACSKDGVTQYYYETSEAPTGTCGVLIQDKERSLVANLGAANLYKHSHTLTDKVKSVIEKAEVYYIASFFLTLPEGPDTALYVAEHAVAHNKTFCINLSAPFLVSFFFEQISKVLPFTDYIFCNETEAHALMEKLEWKCTLEEAAVRLAAMPKKSATRCRTVVFTQGAEETIVARDGSLTKFPVPKLRRENLVDTNGAGDAFVGGFIARLCQGFPLHECVRTGHYAARVVIQQSGCVFPAQPDI